MLLRLYSFPTFIQLSAALIAHHLRHIHRTQQKYNIVCNEREPESTNCNIKCMLDIVEDNKHNLQFKHITQLQFPKIEAISSLSLALKTDSKIAPMRENKTLFFFSFFWGGGWLFGMLTLFWMEKLMKLVSTKTL